VRQLQLGILVVIYLLAFTESDIYVGSLSKTKTDEKSNVSIYECGATAFLNSLRTFKKKSRDYWSIPEKKLPHLSLVHL
jgi:NADH:ubiquinone oxidoreductase subunit 3 (subunit A)